MVFANMHFLVSKARMDNFFLLKHLIMRLLLALISLTLSGGALASKCVSENGPTCLGSKQLPGFLSYFKKGDPCFPMPEYGGRYRIVGNFGQNCLS